MDTLFLVALIIEALFGIGFVLAAATVLGPFGMTFNDIATTFARLFGSALISFPILLWFARKSDKPEFKKGVVFSLFAYFLVSTVLIVITQMDKTPFLKLSRYEKEFYSYPDDARFKRLEVQSQEQLRLLRNEIFARHRHSFDSSELRSSFANQPWYHEYKDHKVSMDELSGVELKVLKAIQNLERITK